MRRGTLSYPPVIKTLLFKGKREVQKKRPAKRDSAKQEQAKSGPGGTRVVPNVRRPTPGEDERR